MNKKNSHLPSDKQTEDNQLPPPPDQIDTDNGKMMWVIEEYKIWARTYQEALELLPLIQSF